MQAAGQIIRQILDTPLSAASKHARIGLRREYRKERAKAVRGLFKTLGLKGISVTAPNYSMAQAIDIHLPRRPECQNPIHRFCPPPHTIERCRSSRPIYAQFAASVSGFGIGG